jgi:hypothetical protein
MNLQRKRSRLQLLDDCFPLPALHSPGRTRAVRRLVQQTAHEINTTTLFGSAA